MLFEDLKALVAVIDCASVTKAAEKLRLTQSAVSRRIQNLEESLGAVLFDRKSRPPMPTPMGIRIYEGAVELLDRAEDLRRIPQEAATPRGKYRVGFTQVVADVVVLEAVTSIRTEFPELEMQVVTDWSKELQDFVTKGDLEAATLIMTAPSTLPTELEGILITTLDILVVQSRTHPIVAPTADIRSLSSIEWILNPKGCGYRTALENAMGGHGKQLKLGIDTHGASIQMRMVAAGLGLGLVPKPLLQESAFRDELSVINVVDFNLAVDVWVAYPMRPGNLKQAHQLLTQQIRKGFSG